MEQRNVGSFELSVSAVGMGCNNFARKGTATETLEGSVAVINAALDADDVSRAAMDRYVDAFRRTWVGTDMETYKHAPAFLENDEMYKEMGLLLADVFHGVYDHDLTPRRHVLKVARDALKKSSLSMVRLARIGMAGIKAL